MDSLSSMLQIGPPKCRAKAENKREQLRARLAPEINAIDSVPNPSTTQTTPPRPPAGSCKTVFQDRDMQLADDKNIHIIKTASIKNEVNCPPEQPSRFCGLPRFANYLAVKRASLQPGKARFASLTTEEEYRALVRVRDTQDIHALRKKGKRPASQSAGEVENEEPGDPQRRYMLRTGGWETSVCSETGERVLVRQLSGGEVNAAGQPSMQTWVHEGNVEWFLWTIHARVLGHPGMDRTWAEVQKTIYGCTQTVCRAYVVACHCVHTPVRSGRKRQDRAAQVSGVASSHLRKTGATVLRASASKASGSQGSACSVKKRSPAHSTDGSDESDHSSDPCIRSRYKKPRFASYQPLPPAFA